MNHSKAPWQGGGEVVLDADGREVCTINRKRKGSTGFVSILQWRGDSKLIAAAPQMYHALRVIQRLMRTVNANDEIDYEEINGPIQYEIKKALEGLR